MCAHGCSGSALAAAEDCREGGNKGSGVPSGSGNTAAGGGSSSAVAAPAETASGVPVAASAAAVTAVGVSSPAATSQDLRPLTMVDMKEAIKQVHACASTCAGHATFHLRNLTPGLGSTLFSVCTRMRESSPTPSIGLRRHQGKIRSSIRFQHRSIAYLAEHGPYQGGFPGRL